MGFRIMEAKRRRKPKVAGLVPLDEETDAWLAQLSQVTGTPREVIVASILRDIRIDDQQADQTPTMH